MYNADSYGSPNRYVGKSPNPNNEDDHLLARGHHPERLGFGNIGDNLRVNDQQIGTGPKSAPAQVKSFDQPANEGNQRAWDKPVFDERTAGQRPSASYADLLAAQLGPQSFNGAGGRGMAPPMARSNVQAQSSESPSAAPAQNNGTSSAITMGRGYDTLRSYVEMARSGR